MKFDRNWVAVVGLAICIFAAAMSWMCIKLAVPTFIETWGSNGHIDWIVAAYVVAEVALIPIAGRYLDVYGEKKLLLIGMVVFAIGAVLGTLSNGIWFFIVARTIQGIGAGIVFAVVFSAVGKLFDHRSRRLPHSAMTLAFALGSLFGAAIGYWFIEQADWRYSLYFVTLLMVVGGVVAYMSLPDRVKTDIVVDIPGMVLLTALVTLMMVYCQDTSTYDVFTMDSLISIILMVAILVLMIYRYREVGGKLFPDSINRVQIVLLAIMLMIGIFGLGMIQMYYKVYLINYAGSIYDASAAFLYLLMGGAITSLIGCRKVYTTGVRVWVMLGSSLMILSFIVCYFLVDQGAFGMKFSLFLLGTGLGCLVTEIIISTQGMTPSKDMGTVSSFTMAIRMLGIVLGNMLFSDYISRGLDTYVDDEYAKFISGFDDIISLINAIVKYLQEHGLIGIVEDLFKEVTALFKECVLICAALCVLCLVLGYTLEKKDVELAIDEEIQKM